MNSINYNWININKPKQNNLLQLKSKTLIIYSYSLSNNLLKDVLKKMGVKFLLTDKITKASIIVGLKSHVRKNFNLIKLSTIHSIPIYTINHVNYYHLTNLFSKLR